MRKTKLDRVLESVGGRFFSLNYRTSKESGSLCAKLVNVSPQYITVEDVNTDVERKFHRSSVIGVSCGDQVYNG